MVFYFISMSTLGVTTNQSVGAWVCFLLPTMAILLFFVKLCLCTRTYWGIFLTYLAGEPEELTSVRQRGCAILFQYFIYYTSYHPKFIFETIAYFCLLRTCTPSPLLQRKLSSNPTTTTRCIYLQLGALVLGPEPPPCAHPQPMNGINGQYPRRCPITTK